MKSKLLLVCSVLVLIASFSLPASAKVGLLAGGGSMRLHHTVLDEETGTSKGKTTGDDSIIVALDADFMLTPHIAINANATIDGSRSTRIADEALKTRLSCSFKGGMNFYFSFFRFGGGMRYAILNGGSDERKTVRSILTSINVDFVLGGSTSSILLGAEYAYPLYACFNTDAGTSAMSLERKGLESGIVYVYVGFQGTF